MTLSVLFDCSLPIDFHIESVTESDIHCVVRFSGELQENVCLWLVGLGLQTRAPTPGILYGC